MLDFDMNLDNLSPAGEMPSDPKQRAEWRRAHAHSIVLSATHCDSPDAAAEHISTVLMILANYWLGDGFPEEQLEQEVVLWIRALKAEVRALAGKQIH